MNKTYLFIFACCAIKFSVAQSLSPEVITSSGTSFDNGSSILDWTLGEPLTTTFSGSNEMLTQGFHQPNLVVTSVDNELATYSVTLSPNPTVDLLQLDIQNKLNEVLFIDLYTIEGKLIKSQQINSTTHLQIDMGTYTTGPYQLSIKNNSGKIKTFRIVKSN